MHHVMFMTGFGSGWGPGGRRRGPDTRFRYNPEECNGLSIGAWASEADEKDPNDLSVSTWTDNMTANWSNDEWTRSVPVSYLLNTAIKILLYH